MVAARQGTAAVDRLMAVRAAELRPREDVLGKAAVDSRVTARRGTRPLPLRDRIEIHRRSGTAQRHHPALPDELSRLAGSRLGGSRRDEAVPMDVGLEVRRLRTRLRRTRGSELRTGETLCF